MRLTGLVESADHVCCRYRLAAFQPHFKRAGHEVTLVSWPATPWAWARLPRADAVVVLRKLLSPWELFWIRRAASILIYDFDDAVFQRDSYAAKGSASHRRRRRFAGTVRAADVVVAGNSFLRAEAARWGIPARVVEIPTCVEPAGYPVANHFQTRHGVQLVWIGSSSTLRGLEAIRPLLNELGRRMPGIRLKLICDRFLKLDHLPIIECLWSEQQEAVDLAAADIGVSWVPDDSWSRGKCGLKVLQYMAAGLPVVANPVGVQAEIVLDGRTGFLVRTVEEWVRAVGRLAADAELRRRLGEAGRRRVEQHYSVAVGAGRWVDVLDRVRARRALTG